MKKYSYPCPWCHARISSYENESSNANVKTGDYVLMCPECEFFYIDEINYSTEAPSYSLSLADF